MTWFKTVFLPSFETGREIQISEKQFRIFERYLPKNKESGYLYTVYGKVDNFNIEAYEWSSVGKHRYYVTIKKEVGDLL